MGNAEKCKILAVNRRVVGSSPKGSETSYSAHVHRSAVGQYGPTCPGIPGIDGIYGNVYSLTYEASMRGSASIPTSRPN